MGKVFSVQDRQTVFDYILSVAAECGRIVSLVQVGSGANGYHDERSDLDFVIALDSDESMPEVMEYMHRKISLKYELAFCKQDESRHLQIFILSDLLEIDIGYGGYEHAAAWKPAFKVLFDHSGTVEEKMVHSFADISRSFIYSVKRTCKYSALCNIGALRIFFKKPFKRI